MKLLYITSLSGRRVNGFMRSAIMAANNLGIDFVMACNMENADKLGYQEDCKAYGIRVRDIAFSRNPFAFSQNYKAYKQLLSLVEEEKFDAIHCNTPVGGVLGRICGRKKKVPCVIYQAHGFHFFKGAPLINWLIYYPVEWLLAHWTDILVTINREDYARAQKRMRAKKVIYVPGVGLNTEKFAQPISAEQRQQIRKEIGVPSESSLLLSVGELNKNKNHAVVLKAMAQLRNLSVHYCVAGAGDYKENLRNLAKKLGIEKQVHLLGYRQDVRELCQAADCFCFPSFREGLSGALMEAMACGMPVICSRIRGNSDLIEDGKGGFLVSPTDVSVWREKIEHLCAATAKAQAMGAYNREKVQEFDLSKAILALEKIYKDI